MATRRLLFPLLVISLTCCCSFIDAQLSESERMKEYRARNYTWPLVETVPNTEGWRKLMQRRFQQVAAIRDTDRRYEGYLQLTYAAVAVPNFTETGFGLSRASDELLQVLQQGIRDGLDGSVRSEGPVDVIEGEEPLFIDRPDLTRRVSTVVGRVRKGLACVISRV